MLSSAINLYKSSYGGLSRNTWWLSLVMLVNRSGTMVVPFLTMYMTQAMGVGIGKAGFVMSLFGAGAIVGALAGGKITDKVGFYYVQLFTLLGGGLMFIVLGQMKSYSAICVTTFFLSMINEAFRPANAVAIAHYSKTENRTRSYSLNRLAINLGWAFGSAIGGILASFNYGLLFWVDGITNISAAVLLFLVFAPSRNTVTVVTKKKTVVIVNSAYRDRTYLFFITIQLVFAICFFQMFTTVPVFYKTGLHLSESYIGINMAFNGILIALFEMIIVFRLEGRRPPVHYMAAGVFLVSISYLALNLPIGNAMVLAFSSMFFVTIGEIISMPFMNTYWISRTNAENRGQYAALYTVAWSSAQATGPFLGAQLAEHFGYHLLWWVIGTTCVLLLPAYWFLQKRS
ncbi:MAG: major facilitator superfamily 1 [Ferruginibacter sp.]|nr:major facilitator superfamily 1 [Ferruginibacter sp.]